MIAIIDYKAGNIASVCNALKRLGADFIITDQKDTLNASDKIIFPGVGHAQSAMASLKENGLDIWLKETHKPLLGICLGMQLLYESTEEGDTQTLGILQGRLKKFDTNKDKVPHIGWNRFCSLKENDLLDGMNKDDYLYYVHSYYAPITSETIASCSYAGAVFSSIITSRNYVGMQFHPEKSGDIGIGLLQNFIKVSSIKS